MFALFSNILLPSDSELKVEFITLLLFEQQAISFLAFFYIKKESKFYEEIEEAIICGQK